MERQEAVVLKLDEIELEEFAHPPLIIHFKRIGLYIQLLASFFRNLSDILVLCLLFSGLGISDLVNKSDPTQNQQELTSPVSLEILKWIYLFCTCASLLLLAMDTQKAVTTIRTEDISLIYSSPFARTFYSLADVTYFNLFSEIEAMKTTKDHLAFFCYSKTRGWKRIMFSSLPRYAITLWTLIVFFASHDYSLSPADYTVSTFTIFVICSMTLFLVLFIFQFLTFIAAFVIYVPLLADIGQNLKEYICQKIDKRIAELMAMESRHRYEMAKKANFSLTRAIPSFPPFEFEASKV